MPSPDGVEIVALRGLNVGRRTHLTVAPGTSVADMVAAALPGLALPQRDLVRVTIGESVVPRDWWAYTRPKPGTAVVIRVVPAGGATRSILALVVTVAAIVIAPYIAPAIAGALSITSAAGIAAVTSVTAAALATAGAALLNAFVPLRPPGAGGSAEQASPTYSITGFQNAFSPNSVIPNVLGRHRFAPPYAALPYTEIVDNEQYAVAAFNLGYGPLEIENIRLGDTSIDVLTNVQIEVRQGFDDDTPLTLYPEQVIEESLDAEGQNPPVDDDGNEAGIEVIRTTARDTEDVSIDITFPEGLAEYNNDGDPQNLTVDILIRQRELGELYFSDVTTLSIMRASREVVRVSHRWTLPSRGQWEIGVTRITEQFTDVQQRGRCFWSALRSHRPEYPIAFDRPLALVAVRIKATGELSGIINNLNADVTRICPDWDGDAAAWIAGPTRNPASLFRYVLQGNANAYPEPDGKVALAELAAWHEHCEEQGLFYDRVHDFEGSLWDALVDIAAAGRATPRDNGEAWSVVIDRPRDTVIGHLSPRNAWGFQGERTYLDPPDGFRVTFRDELNGYQPVERVIPWPGFVGEPEIAEEIELPGVTNPTQVFREARRRQYEVIHRPDRYTVTQDIEGLVLVRGDLAVVSHDVLDRVQTAARVRAIDGNNVVLDAAVAVQADTSYGVRFRLADGTSLLKAVTGAEVGETELLTFSGGAMPEVGDLALFGALGSETREVIVKDVEIGDNLTFRLTLVDHAPQIEALANADELPEWAEPADPEPISQGRPTIATGWSGDNSSVPSFNVPLPGSIGDGDLLLMFVGVLAGGALTLSTPSGWTQLYSIVGPGNKRRFAAYYRTGDGGEGTSVAVANSGSGEYFTVAYRIPEWMGTPEAATATGSGSPANPPSLTPSWGSDANHWIAAGFAFGNVGAPAGYSNLVKSFTGGGIVTAQRNLEAASENPGFFSTSQATWAAATVAVQLP